MYIYTYTKLTTNCSVVETPHWEGNYGGVTGNEHTSFQLGSREVIPEVIPAQESRGRLLEFTFTLEMQLCIVIVPTWDSICVYVCGNMILHVH